MKEINVTIEKTTKPLETDVRSFIGSLDKFYRHIQAEPSEIWIVEHKLNKFPSVTVVDSAGTVVIGEVQFIDVNKAKLIFSGAFSGEAYFN